MARKTVSDILARLGKIPAFPEIGARRDYVRPGLRMVMKRKYAAYYILNEKEVVIVRVLHGSRDVEALVGGEPDLD